MTHTTETTEPTLTVGAANDVYEQQADAVADQIMRMPEMPLVQRKCAHCQEEDIQRKPLASFIQRKAYADGGMASSMVTNQVQATQGGGSPLSATTRHFMESRFSTDFSGVNIHTGDYAVQLSRELNAQAFTVGNDIYFNQGKFTPESEDGKRLLAHELTHTVQQSGRLQSKRIQRDLAVEPLRPDAVGRTLTQRQIEAAIQYNSARITNLDEIALIRDILGLPRDPATIDEEFINAVATYQAQYRQTSDGKIGASTMVLLAKEIHAAADSLTSAGRPVSSLDVAFALQTQLEGFVAAANGTYADYKTAIQAASILNRTTALQNETLLRGIKGLLSWNDFARVVELLGRIIPTAAMLLADRTVRAALGAAFRDSNAAVTMWDTHDPSPARAGHACNPAPGAAVATLAHEEGGWVYLNIITDTVTTRRAVAGGQAAINLEAPAPPVLADSVIVATFHTHPNVGACWNTAARPVFPSGADAGNANRRGVPNLIRGAFPNVADIHDVSTGPTRQHLAGSQRFPGARGGLAPQESILRPGEDNE